MFSLSNPVYLDNDNDSVSTASTNTSRGLNMNMNMNVNVNMNLPYGASRSSYTSKPLYSPLDPSPNASAHMDTWSISSERSSSRSHFDHLYRTSTPGLSSRSAFNHDYDSQSEIRSGNSLQQLLNNPSIRNYRMQPQSQTQSQSFLSSHNWSSSNLSDYGLNPSMNVGSRDVFGQGAYADLHQQRSRAFSFNDHSNMRFSPDIHVRSFSLFTHSLTHSFIHSFIHSFVRSFVRSFVHSFTHSLTHI